MSTIRMAPEVIATLRTGEIVRVVEGGAPRDAQVIDVRLEGGVEGYPQTIVVQVDDGIGGDRLIVFETLVPITPSDVAALREAIQWSHDAVLNRASPDEFAEDERRRDRLLALVDRLLVGVPE